MFPFTIFLLPVLIENSIGVRERWTILRELEISKSKTLFSMMEMCSGRPLRSWKRDDRLHRDPESGIFHRREFVVWWPNTRKKVAEQLLMALAEIVEPS